MPALTAQDVRDARFTPTKFREGYDVEDVDALLDRVASSLDELAAGRRSPTTLTGDEVLNATFAATKFRAGYDQDQVDDFLDRAVLALRAGHARVDVHERSQGGARGPGAAGPAAATGAEWVRAARSELTPVRLAAGYATADVDDLLDRAAQALDWRARGGRAHLTARDVREARLGTTWWGRGYPQHSVVLLLDEVGAALGE